MKQNKRVVYVLLPVAFGIWGIIGYKIWQGINTDTESNIVTKTKKQTKEYKKPHLDSVALLLNYPDPFLKGKSLQFAERKQAVIKSSGANTSRELKPIPQPLQVPIIWPEVEYLGMIENHAKGTRVALLRISGKEFMVKEKEQKEGLVANRILKDSVELTLGKNSKFVKKK